MTAVPVGSDEPSNPNLQTTVFDKVGNNDKRLGVLEKAAILQTAGLIVGTVTNGDTGHAPSGDAVYDFTLTEISDAFADHILTDTAVLDFPNLLAFTSADLTVTVTGAAVGDSVALGPPATIEAGLLWCGWVSAADTVSVRVYNLTGIAVNPASATWRVTVFK